MAPALGLLEQRLLFQTWVVEGGGCLGSFQSPAASRSPPAPPHDQVAREGLLTVPNNGSRYPPSQWARTPAAPSAAAGALCRQGAAI